MASPFLEWRRDQTYQEAILGCFEEGDGVRFSLNFSPTCYRRGPWRLLIEVTSGQKHVLWGCFDEQDQPTRYYHGIEAALSEAQAIANVLWHDRYKRHASNAEGAENLEASNVRS